MFRSFFLIIPWLNVQNNDAFISRKNNIKGSSTEEVEETLASSKNNPAI